MIPAVYCRVSTEEQVQRQTIEGQREYAEHYLKLHGMPQARFYEDLGVSGTVPVEKRPAGANLLRDVAAGSIKLVLVYRVDRLARSLLELLRFVDTLDKHGAALRSQSEPFDTGSALGRAFLALLGTFAQLERDAIRERTMQGKDRAAREGRWHGGPPPYGYRLTESRLVVQPEEAAVVREIYHLCMEGYIVPAIARLLNARGLPNPTRSRPSGYPQAGRWSRSTIQQILHQRAYRGEAEFRRGTIACLPLVDAEIWDAVQRRLKDNRDLSVQPDARLYPLRGLVRCGSCGTACCGTTASARGRKYHYYHCSRDRWDREGCAAPHLSAAFVEGVMWKACQEILRHPDAAVEALKQRQAQQQEGAPETESEARQIEQLLAQKTEERARVLTLGRRGVITEQEAERELGEVAGEMLALQDRLRALQIRQGDQQAMQSEVAALTAALGRLARLADSQDPTDWREVFQAVVQRVELGPGREDVTYWTLIDAPVS